jgi:hypothetical protein
MCKEWWAAVIVPEVAMPRQMEHLWRTILNSMQDADVTLVRTCFTDDYRDELRCPDGKIPESMNAVHCLRCPLCEAFEQTGL